VIRPLRVVALDLATAAGIAATHDSDGNPRLAVHTVNASLLPLHDKVHRIEMQARIACGVSPRVGGPPRSHAIPDLVMVEGTFSRPGAADYPLHAMRANVLQWLWRVGIPYVEVQPSTLKVWATGSGATNGENKVTKADVCRAIVETYGRFLNINPRDDNACDAVALLTMGLAKYGQALVDPLPHGGWRALKAITEWPELDLTEAAA
jgi:crossover junction endodeoxyribonuclease RuvC